MKIGLKNNLREVFTNCKKSLANASCRWHCYYWMCKSHGDGSFFSFLLPSWPAVRSWPHLEVRDPIWGDDWLHSPFIRWSPSRGFPEYSSAVRQIWGDLCIAPCIISLSPLSIATDMTDMKLRAKNLDRSWWHCQISLKLFWPQPMTP